MSSTALLSRISLATTLTLVGIGGFTRGSGSGYGCADRWPLCEGGAFWGLIPRWEYHMVIEWVHRWTAAVLGILVLATLISVWRHYRPNQYVVQLATTSLVVVVIQGLIGRSVVRTDLDADLVVLHLAISMVVVGLLTLLVVALWPDTSHSQKRTSDPVWTTHLTVAAAGSYSLLLLGGFVHNRYFPGWPLLSDGIIPDFSDRYLTLHWLHRLGAGLGLVYLGWILIRVKKIRRPADEQRLLQIAALAYVLNIALGAVHVFTEVSSGAVVTAHLMGSSLVWATLVATTARSRTAMDVS